LLPRPKSAGFVADSLVALVCEQLKHDPFSGTILLETGGPSQNPDLGVITKSR
jgi:hypothetical protein